MVNSPGGHKESDITEHTGTRWENKPEVEQVHALSIGS